MQDGKPSAVSSCQSQMPSEEYSSWLDSVGHQFARLDDENKNRWGE